jgi:fluoroquinolone resistance protein
MCRFSELDLNNTVFIGSVLRETDFSHSTLKGAYFNDCDLRGSLFHHCDLSGADFMGASGVSINPLTNKLNNARFSKDEALHLLAYLGIRCE